MTFAVRTWLLLLTIMPCAAEDPPPPADKGAAATDTIPAADRETISKIARNKVSMDFDGVTLRDALVYLQETTTIRFQSDDGLNLDRLLTLHARDITARTSLSLLFSPDSTGYFVRDGIVHIAPIEAVKDQDYWETYDVAEILKTLEKARGTTVDTESVVRALEEHVARDDRVKGKMTIEKDMLIVRQTGKVHGELRKYFVDLATGMGSGDDVAVTALLENRKIDMDFSEASLGEIMEYVRGVTGINVLFREGVDKDLPSTASLKDVSPFTALDRILTPLGYGYYAEDGILYIALKEQIAKRNDPASPWKAFLQSVGKPRVIK